MKVCLKTQAKLAKQQSVIVNVNERLPFQLARPCQVACTFDIEANKDHYQLILVLESQVAIICQRCLGEFQHHYHHQSQLAVCADEMLAESLMSSYECIVSHNDEIDLVDIVTDDLHLYLPEKHNDIQDCAPVSY